MNEIKPSFFKYPFAYLASFLALGIIIGYKNPYDSTIFFFVSSALFLSGVFVFSRSKLNPYFIILIAVIFTAIGILDFKTYKDLHFSNQKTGSFIVLRVDEFQQKNEWSKGIAQVCELENSILKPTKKRILFYSNSNQVIHKNDILQVNTELIPIKNKNNPGDFNLELFWFTKGIQEMCFFQGDDFQLIDRVKGDSFTNLIDQIGHYFTGVMEKFLDGEELSIAKALILGDKSSLETEIRNSFSNTGAMHVLAVSGLHVGIITPILIGFFQLFSRFIRRYQAVLLVVCILWIYALLTGFSPSVIRAVFMFSILSLAQITGKNYSSVNILFFTAFVLLLINPLYLFDIGFQLSYLAMLGIFVLNGKISNWLKFKNKYVNFFWQGTAIGISAQFFTAPLTIYYFHQFPNYFALTNLGLMLFSGAILTLGIVLFALNFIPIVNALVGFILFLSIFLMFEFILWIENLPGAVAFGYTITIPLILIFTLTIVILNLIKPSTKLWKISAFIFVVALGLTSYNRFQNLQSKHICVFNNNQLVLTIKNNSNIVCLYDLPKSKLSKVKMTISSYQKCYPGEIEYVSIYKKNTTLNFDKQQFKVTKAKEGRVFKSENRKFKIIYSNKYSIASTDITMPWIKHENSLNLGAKLFSLN